MSTIQLLSDFHLVNETINSLLEDSYVAFRAIELKPSLIIAILSIIFNPLYWNLVARNEYRNKTLTKLFGSKEVACGLFSASVFLLGLLRDYLFNLAIKDQSHGPDAFPLLATREMIAASYILLTCGSMFVGFSMYELGIFGTYLGDYFGIFLGKRVVAFPFNVLDNPMYVGSTMLFLGTSIWHASPTGLVLSAFVYFVYMFAALGFEESFTNMIYVSLMILLKDNLEKMKAQKSK